MAGAASVSWPRALAWRLRRQLLDPMPDASPSEVVQRLGAVPALPEHLAELAVAARRRDAQRGDVAAAVADGSIIKAYAFRGAVHLMTPQDGGAFLALRAASRMWERSSWQSYYGLTPADWPPFRRAVRDALADGPVTLDRLGVAVTGEPAFAHLREVFANGAGTLIKPLMWQGDMCFGPAREGAATFQRLDANPRWAGIPELEEAGPRAVLTYLRAYGPAGSAQLHYWIGEGLGVGRGKIGGWLTALGDRLAEVDVEGRTLLVDRDDLSELTATPPTQAVRLLPGYDQWVLGPGTADAHVVPPARRALVSRKANLVTGGGVLCGTWTTQRDRLAVTWFAEAPPPDRDALVAEAGRLSGFLGTPLDLTIEVR